MKKISNRKMCHEALAKIIFGHFCRHGIKTWKSWPSFFKFQSMSILAILCNRLQETISTWLNIAFNYSFLRTPVGWIKCEYHYWLVCVQTLPRPFPLPAAKIKEGTELCRIDQSRRETENNACAKFWGDKQRALWYVMVFSGVVNICSSRGARGGGGEQQILCRLLNAFGNSNQSSRVMIGINESFLRVFCIFDERMRAITNLESFPGLINW